MARNLHEMCIHLEDLEKCASRPRDGLQACQPVWCRLGAVWWSVLADREEEPLSAFVIPSMSLLQGLRDALRLPNPRVDSSRRRSLLAADHLASPPPNGGSTALIVVDAQRCWYSNAANGRARTAFPALPQRLKALLEGARQEGIPVVHLRASYESSPHVSTMRRLNPSLNINPIVPDDPEPWARELEGEDVIYKSTFDGAQQPG